MRGKGTNQVAADQPNAIGAIAPRLLRRHEAASYLSISVATLDALRAQGEVHAVLLPAVRRVGESLRVPLFDRADLDAAIQRWKSHQGGAR